MRKRSRKRGWNVGRKTTVSYLLVAFLTILLAVALCYLFCYQYSRNYVIDELQRQASAIADRESQYDIQERASRSNLLSAYQELTDAAVFYVDYEGEALHLKRYTPSVTDMIAANEQESSPWPEVDVHNDYIRVELFDRIDEHFIERVISGEEVTELKKFVFAEDVIVFAGAPIVKEGDGIAGGIILARPVTIVRSIGDELCAGMLAPMMLSVMIACFLAIILVQKIVVPIQRMNRVARKMTEGDYVHSIEVRSGDELNELGRILNALSCRLAQVIESLKEERDRLQLIIGSIGEGILAVDQQLGIVHFNQAFLGLMELDKAEEMYKATRPEISSIMQALQQAEETGLRQMRSFSNPSHRELRAEVSPLHDMLDGCVGAVCLLADVSEANRIEQLRKDYVANISHELRTPLTGIRGMIEPLIDGCMETEEDRQSSYLIIQHETARLEKLVGEMLDMSRLQDGRMSIELERLELLGIIEYVIVSMTPHAKEAGVILKSELDEGLLQCMGNGDRIVQVLVILLDNAIDYTPEGGVVTISAHENGDCIEIGVQDTGCGIEPKDMPFIFERFYKADHSRMRTKGVGLGLSIAKLVVELMGGCISVISEPGKGAKFVFTLKR